MKKRKQNKKYKYTFSDRTRDIRNKAVNYGVNTIILLLLAIPVVFYFDKPVWCAINIFTILVILFFMFLAELIYMVLNYREYMRDERLISAIDKAHH